MSHLAVALLEPVDKEFFEKLLFVLLQHYGLAVLPYKKCAVFRTWTALLGGHSITQYDLYIHTYLARRYKLDDSNHHSELLFVIHNIMHLLNRRVHCSIKEDMSVLQAAEKLKADTDTVLKACANGTLEFVVKPDGEIAIDVFSVMNLLAIA